MAYVYVLKCSDKSFYTGATKDIKKRLSKHKKGMVKYTKSRLPVDLVFLKRFVAFKDALKFEKKVKSWKKRSSILKMLNKDDNLVRN